MHRISQRLRPLEAEGARVGICLSLERSFGSLLPTSVSALRLRRERPSADNLLFQPFEGAVLSLRRDAGKGRRGRRPLQSVFRACVVGDGGQDVPYTSLKIADRSEQGLSQNDQIV
jgi:hypothetical protein